MHVLEIENCSTVCRPPPQGFESLVASTSDSFHHTQRIKLLENALGVFKSEPPQLCFVQTKNVLSSTKEELYQNV